MELRIEPKIETRKFDDPLLEKKFVIESNINRRHLTTFQKIELSLHLLEIERELAKRRKLSRLKKGDELPVTANLQGRGEAVEIVAKKIGVKPRIYYYALYCIEHAPPEELEKLRSGERAISNLYMESKRWKTIEELKEKAKHLKAPEGEYDVIVIDPPWAYGTKYDPEGRRIASPYPEMSIEELKKLKIPASKNCILWLWTTNAFMHEAYHLLEAWGFEPKTILTWVKDRMGIGDWLRGKTEHCILAVKGHPMVNLTNQTTVLFAKRREHSRKPDEFYNLVESLCYGRKLDYFGRDKKEGWEVYGTMEMQN